MQNVVHTTTAGTVATWYFLSNQSLAPRHATLSSLKRALTWSFGSICFGSLLVALLRWVEVWVRHAAERSEGFIAMCMAAFGSWLIRMMEWLLQYFNLYAFVQVAIYGKDYLTAARDTWRLVQRAGLYAVINDNLIFTSLNVASFVCAIFVGAVALSLAAGTAGGDVTFAATYCVVGFVMGLTVIAIMTTVISSAVITLFVCYAEAPLVLQQLHPDVYQRICVAHLSAPVV